MRNRISISVFFLVSCFFAFAAYPQEAQACSPAPWSAAELAEASEAILHGTVMAVRQEGRRATVEVIHYIGPGDAPRFVHLPPTVSSQSDAVICPDFSIIFQKDREYVIFLKSAGPSPALLNEYGLTALVVEENAVNVDIRGGREELPTLLRQWAEMRDADVKEPRPGAAVWGEGDEKRGMPGIWMVAVAIMLIGMGAHATARKRSG